MWFDFFFQLNDLATIFFPHFKVSIKYLPTKNIWCYYFITNNRSFLYKKNFHFQVSIKFSHFYIHISLYCKAKKLEITLSHAIDLESWGNEKVIREFFLAEKRKVKKRKVRNNICKRWKLLESNEEIKC